VFYLLVPRHIVNLYKYKVYYFLSKRNIYISFSIYDKKMAIFKLNKKDKRILSELDMDARQPISKIAKKVRLSKEVTNYRIKRLEKEGIIEGYYAVIDILSLGYIYCRYHLCFYNMEPHIEKEIIKYLKVNHPLSWIISTTGEADFVIVIGAKSILEIKKIGDIILHKLGKFIKEKKVYVVARKYHFKHNYLYNDQDLRTEILGNNPKKIEIDATSIKILNMLSRNARLQSSEIASKVGLTANAVRARIKNLIKQGVILCFRIKINVSKLHYQHFRVFLNLKDVTDESYKKIKEFLHKEPCVIFITEALGKSDLEFQIIIRSHTDFYTFMNNMRQIFGQLIVDYDYQFVYKEHQVYYFPG